ncbi:MAG: nucleoside permease [Kordiimonadaceae bacterium]|nr:nucleoside permease [Kordiimonadaceae bacterium]MBT6036574.1 nucleoside permease [Kordiimonadaceae bacterium]MBT6330035.1 nucleoside permease [Kordiimonadaceae bacterium]
MNSKIYSQLSVMMFLQLFVWGAWFVTLGNYLANIGFSATDIGTAYLTNNIGAIIAPLFVGLIADRFFPAEKVMALLHLIGAAVLYYVSDLESSGAIIVGLLIYNACYMPTLALANAVSFHQMNAPEEQFPKIRVWGTIGWIAAGLSITFLLGSQFDNVEATTIPMKMGAIGSVLLSLYCITLPSTPPKSKGRKVSIGELFGSQSFALLKDKPFAIFAACSLLISIPLAFYYTFANLFLNELGMVGAASKMTIGQVSEVFFMALMPFFFRRLGVKWMLLVGMLAWVVRYALFSAGDMDSLSWMIYGGIILHGVCYDFFFVTGQVYVDKKASAEIRSSAQSFITLLTYGFGLAIGTMLSGRVIDALTTDGVRDWSTIWMIPGIFAAVIAVIFFFTFNENEKAKEVD